MLLGEVDVCAHAGQFHQPLERDFAPAPAHIRPAQRRHEIPGLARQGALAARQAFHLALEGGEGVDALALDALNLGLGAGQRLADRLDQRFDRGLAFLERRGRVARLPGQALARQLQEYLAVALQAVAGQVPEHALQLLASAREREVAFRGGAVLRADPGAQHLELDPKRLLAPRAPDERGENPDEAAADAGREQRRPGAVDAHDVQLQSNNGASTLISGRPAEMCEVIDVGIGG